MELLGLVCPDHLRVVEFETRAEYEMAAGALNSAPRSPHDGLTPTAMIIRLEDLLRIPRGPFAIRHTSTLVGWNAENPGAINEAQSRVNFIHAHASSH